MNKFATVLAVLLLAACSEQRASDADNSSPQDKPTRNTLIQPQLDALEKAKGVEGLLEQQQRERDKLLQDQGM